MTGRRVAAALLDIAVLFGLLVILSQVVGRTSAEMGGIRAAIHLGTITRPGHGPVDIGVYGAWTLLFGTIVGAYYFVLEAWSGQTVGKALLGLRVAGRDGTRAGPGNIAGRTLLRMLDGLPLCYLVGYVSVLLTGARRARLGDLAAGTAVVAARPAHPARRRATAAAALIAVLAAAVGLPAYRLTSPGGPPAYQAHGVSFTYPAAWRQVPASDLESTNRGTATWTAALALGSDDLIVVEAVRQDPPVTSANFASFTPGFGRELRQHLADLGWSAEAGPERVTVGGMPAEETWVSGRTSDGAAVRSLEIYAYHGATEYHLACQHTPRHARQVTAACAEVMRTFTVAGVPSRAAAGPFSTPSWRFETDAAAVCERASERVPPADRQASSDAQVAAAFSRLARFFDHTLAGFAGVRAPASWQYPFGEFLAHTGQLRDAVANLALLIRDGDVSGATRQWHAAQAAASRLRSDNRWLTGHGLATCTPLSKLL